MPRGAADVPLSTSLAEVQKGIGTAEHKAFVARLAETRSTT